MKFQGGSFFAVFNLADGPQRRRKHGRAASQALTLTCSRGPERAWAGKMPLSVIPST